MISRPAFCSRCFLPVRRTHPSPQQHAVTRRFAPVLASAIAIAFAGTVEATGIVLSDARSFATVFASGANGGRATTEGSFSLGSLDVDAERSGGGSRSRPGGVTVNTQAVGSVIIAGGDNPQTQAIAFSSTTPVGGSSTAVSSSTRAEAYLTYQVRIDPKDLPDDFVVGFLPVDIGIDSFAEANVSAAARSVGTSATALNSVFFSTDPFDISTSPGGVTFRPPDDLRIFIDSALADSAVTESVSDLSVILQDNLLSSTTYYVLKSSVAFTQSQNSGADGASADATAILDPAFAINQSLFQSTYADQCLRDFGGDCPDVTTLFSINYSPGVTQGSLSNNVPLPATLALLLVGLSGLAFKQRNA